MASNISPFELIEGPGLFVVTLTTEGKHDATTSLGVSEHYSFVKNLSLYCFTWFEHASSLPHVQKTPGNDTNGMEFENH